MSATGSGEGVLPVVPMGSGGEDVNVDVASISMLDARACHSKILTLFY